MVILKYIKDNEGMFFAHLDTLRAFNRALSRSNIDVKYSQGFNQNRLIFFACPSPIGIESDCEYVEITTDMDKAEVFSRLSATLPKHVRLVTAFYSEKKLNITASLARADYEIVSDELQKYAAQINDLMSQPEFVIQYKVNDVTRVENVKDKIVSFEIKNNKIYICGEVGAVNFRVDRFVASLQEKLGIKPCVRIRKTKTYVSINGKILDVDDLLRQL